MARKPRSDGRGPGGAEANREVAYEWFATADSDVAACAEWDPKAQLFVEAVLALLSKGRGVMFSLSFDQTEIRVTVYDGDNKAAVKVRDSMELDDTMGRILERAEQLDKLPRRKWQDSPRR